MTCFLTLALVACSDDLNEESNAEKGVPVGFIVSDMQDATATGAAKSAFFDTRATFSDALAMQGITTSDLTTHQFELTGDGGSNLSLIETTVAGVNPVQKEVHSTRANISTSITEDFSTLGYNGTTESDISNTPWFYSKDTYSNGSLVTPIFWNWDQPYACFYAVSPQVSADYSKLTLSPETYAGTPYIDFEVEADVKNQKDLMTACSGMVHYEIRGTAPQSHLKFQHALTAVRFKVGQNLSWNKFITKVEIIGAKSKGRYTLPTDANGGNATWTDLTTPATFTLGGDGTVNVSTAEAVNQIIVGRDGDNYTFYMIPQTLAGIRLKIYFSDGTNVSTKLSGEWKAGTTKTYSLSESKSTWEYQLQVTNPTVAAYTDASTTDYTITSYRIAPGNNGNNIQQPVSWRVVGYQESADNGTTWTELSTEKPAWLTSLSMSEGAGGTAAQTGKANLDTKTVDKLATYNKVLQDATAKGTEAIPYNLSNTNGSADIQNTANSYLISAPGWYRIPLVYGNAVKNGTSNESSYKATVTGSSVLTTFKDHAGADITSPYINVQNQSSPATQASIVWTDQSGIVEANSLKIEGSGENSFVKFRIPADKIKNGNAVIAVKNAAGTIMWSWHLWFAHSDALDPIPVKNHQGTIYNFSKQTLGFAYRQWSGSAYEQTRIARLKIEQTVANNGQKQVAYIDIKQTPGGKKEVSATIYQNGRKDAMPGISKVSDGEYKIADGPQNIATVIQNPNTFYKNAVSPYAVYNESYYNYWANNCNTATWTAEKVTKTVYDPCPAGFALPTKEAFTGFTTTGKSSSTSSEFNVSGGYDLGWYFKSSTEGNTVYFPSTGWRGYNSGVIVQAGNTFMNAQGTGYYWSASRSNAQNYYYLSSSSGNLSLAPVTYQTSGWAIHPVAE